MLHDPVVHFISPDRCFIYLDEGQVPHDHLPHVLGCVHLTNISLKERQVHTRSTHYHLCVCVCVGIQRVYMPLPLGPIRTIRCQFSGQRHSDLIHPAADSTYLISPIARTHTHKHTLMVSSGCGYSGLLCVQRMILMLIHSERTQTENLLFLSLL